MDDKKLLEFAAKAAGMEPCEIWGMPFVKGDSVAPRLTWNPLTDDGDALRLGVYLGLIGLQSYNGEDCKKAGQCPYAATRRAIVRAAAAIGEQMP